MYFAARSDASVELFENLASQANLGRGAHQSYFVAAGSGIDAELSLENAEGAISLPVEGRGGLVVVKDEGLTGGGVVCGQGVPSTIGR